MREYIEPAANIPLIGEVNMGRLALGTVLAGGGLLTALQLRSLTSVLLGGGASVAGVLLVGTAFGRIEPSVLSAVSEPDVQLELF